jgi:hypothetical protein
MSTDFVVVQKNWDSITYCSDPCRKHKIKPDSLDIAFESKILELLSQRRVAQGADAVVACEEAEEETLKKYDPLNVTDIEDISGEGSKSQRKSKPLRVRERCRQAARRLAARGEILITQDGKAVDPSFAKGVMELKFSP